MDVGERTVAEREAEASAELLLDALDLAERHSRMRALVVTVLEDDAGAVRTADVIDRLLERRRRCSFGDRMHAEKGRPAGKASVARFE